MVNQLIISYSLSRNCTQQFQLFKIKKIGEYTLYLHFFRCSFRPLSFPTCFQASEKLFLKCIMVKLCYIDNRKHGAAVEEQTCDMEVDGSSPGNSNFVKVVFLFISYKIK
jgi:hypothetical protein